jgi:hypothetical protein
MKILYLIRTYNIYALQGFIFIYIECGRLYICVYLSHSKKYTHSSYGVYKLYNTDTSHTHSTTTNNNNQQPIIHTHIYYNIYNNNTHFSKVLKAPNPVQDIFIDIDVKKMSLFFFIMIIFIYTIKNRIILIKRIEQSKT